MNTGKIIDLNQTISTPYNSQIGSLKGLCHRDFADFLSINCSENFIFERLTEDITFICSLNFRHPSLVAYSQKRRLNTFGSNAVR